MAGADKTELEEPDYFFVSKKVLEDVKEKLKKGEDVTEQEASTLTCPTDLPDDEVMVPVDMRGTGKEFDHVGQLQEKFGPKGVAEAFIAAREYFEKNPDKTPEDERPKEMSAKEWKDVLDEVESEGEEEELMEGEEEDLLEEAEEEVEEIEEPEEPKAKKAKTS